jgi:hypothetical protein
MLPDQLHHRTFRDALTGAELQPAVAGAEGWLFAGQIFGTLPVGMLIAN